jgi:hypothetical protein
MSGRVTTNIGKERAADSDSDMCVVCCCSFGNFLLLIQCGCEPQDWDSRPSLLHFLDISVDVYEIA